jgi:pimeloyl-ACP methyl ester carboxylesterase
MLRQGTKNMPFFDRPGIRLFYEDVGDGPAIIGVHGLMGPSYWLLSDVAGWLGQRYRFISFDMRGHGRTTVCDADADYTVDAIAADIGALADHLGLSKFHLLGHSAGGMVSARFAMSHHDRLLSLMLCCTSSYTSMMPPGHFEKQADIIEKTARDQFYENMRNSPAGEFIARLDNHPQRDKILRLVKAMFANNDPQQLACFVRAFFTDPDPHIEALRKINCPTLIVAAACDAAFLEPSALMKREIPDSDLVILPDLGHMFSFENFEAVTDCLDAFLDGAAAP